MKKKKRKKAGKKTKKVDKKSDGSGSVRSLVAKLHGELLDFKGLNSQVRVRTGVLPLDLILTPDVGLRGGGVIELFGKEGVGKSSLILSLIREAKAIGMMPFLADVEHAVNESQCEIFGIEPNKDFLMIQPDDAEQALDTAAMILTTQPKTLVIIDSIAALVAGSEYSESVGTKNFHPTSQMLTKFAKMAPKLCRRNDSLVVYVNQLRANTSGYGPAWKPAGPAAVRYLTSWRVEMSPGDKLKQGGEDGEIVGHKVKFKCIKNKFGRPFQTAQSNLIYGQGFHQGYDLCDLVKAFGLKNLIQFNGSWFEFYNGEKLQGQANAANYIIENPKVEKKITDYIIGTVTGVVEVI